MKRLIWLILAFVVSMLIWGAIYVHWVIILPLFLSGVISYYLAALTIKRKEKEPYRITRNPLERDSDNRY